MPEVDRSAGRVGEQLEQVVLKRLQDDKLLLPALPSVAARGLELVQKPDFGINNVVQFIETDPSLAARIMRTVNSAGVLASTPATNLQAATIRLGQRNLRSAVLELSAAATAESRDRRITEAVKAVWQHAVALAILARDIGILVGISDPEDCYLAGLLHDAGKSVLAIFLLETERALSGRTTKPWMTADAWIQCLGQSHRIGLPLAKKWHFPPAAMSAIEQPYDYASEDRYSVANVVRFSSALCKQQGLYMGEVGAEDINAIVMIGRSLLGLDDDRLVRVVGTLQDKVADALKS